MIRLCVIGDPVAHSLSPAIHNAAMRAAGIEGSYSAVRIRAGTLGIDLPQLRADFAGCNVTTPLKEEAVALCDWVDPFARRVGAVNTLAFSGGVVRGWNTDGEGAALAVAWACGAGRVEGLRVAVLGTGPAARAAALGIAARHGRVVVWGRREGGLQSMLATVEGASAWTTQPVDAVLSTLPPGVELPDALLAPMRGAPAVVDANYGERSDLSARLGRPVCDGRAMLVAQAAASFRLWFGIEPDLEAMAAAANLQAAYRISS